eukprot:1195063-Amphidinium_carterae.1
MKKRQRSRDACRPISRGRERLQLRLTAIGLAQLRGSLPSSFQEYPPWMNELMQMLVDTLGFILIFVFGHNTGKGESRASFGPLG